MSILCISVFPAFSSGPAMVNMEPATGWKQNLKGLFGGTMEAWPCYREAAFHSGSWRAQSGGSIFSPCHFPSLCRQVTDQSPEPRPKPQNPAQLQNGARPGPRQQACAEAMGPGVRPGRFLSEPAAPNCWQHGFRRAAAGACTISSAPDARSGYLW